MTDSPDPTPRPLSPAAKEWLRESAAQEGGLWFSLWPERRRQAAAAISERDEMRESMDSLRNFLQQQEAGEPHTHPARLPVGRVIGLVNELREKLAEAKSYQEQTEAMTIRATLRAEKSEGEAQVLRARVAELEIAMAAKTAECERLHRAVLDEQGLARECARAAGVWDLDQTIAPEIARRFPDQIRARVAELKARQPASEAEVEAAIDELVNCVEFDVTELEAGERSDDTEAAIARLKAIILRGSAPAGDGWAALRKLQAKVLTMHSTTGDHSHGCGYEMCRDSIEEEIDRLLATAPPDAKAGDTGPKE